MQFSFWQHVFSEKCAKYPHFLLFRFIMELANLLYAMKNILRYQVYVIGENVGHFLNPFACIIMDTDNFQNIICKFSNQGKIVPALSCR